MSLTNVVTMSHSLNYGPSRHYWFFLLSLSSSRPILHPFNSSALGHFCSLSPIPIPIQNKPLHHRYHYIVQSLQHPPSIAVIIHYQPNQLGKNGITLLCYSRINSYSLPLYHVNRVISRKVLPSSYFSVYVIHELQCTKLIQ